MKVRSHDLDRRLEALGHRLVRRDPEKFATWNIIPTRRKCWLGLANLDVVESLATQMEDDLRLEFGRWLDGMHLSPPVGPEALVSLARQFLVESKGFPLGYVGDILRRWYEPVGVRE